MTFGFCVDVCLGLYEPGMTPKEMLALTIKEFYWVLRSIRIRRYQRELDISWINAPHVLKYRPPEPPKGTYLYGNSSRNKNRGLRRDRVKIPTFAEERERLIKKYNIEKLSGRN